LAKDEGCAALAAIRQRAFSFAATTRDLSGFAAEAPRART